jgi:teichoic acid transport system permease protein
MFNIGAALIVARLGGSLADVSELIPFILRISRYFCGVMYMITALPGYVPWGVLKLLSLNPPAVFISLVRVALMQSYRQNSPGNKPYNRGACYLFHHPPAGKAPIPSLQAYCHAVVTNNDLWLAAVGWGVGFFVLGVIFFWQAESQYGRG